MLFAAHGVFQKRFPEPPPHLKSTDAISGTWCLAKKGFRNPSHTHITSLGSNGLHMASLLEIVQNSWKVQIRNDFITGIRRREHLYKMSGKRAKDTGASASAMPLPRYDFATLFDQVLLRNGARPDLDLFGYVLCQSENEDDNLLVRHCLSSCVTPRLQNRCMQFIEFVVSVDRRAACNMLDQFSPQLQVDILHPDFHLANLQKIMHWDRMVGSPLMCNSRGSHMHLMMRNARVDYPSCVMPLETPPIITTDIVHRLRLTVACYGEAYLAWVPTNDHYAQDTLVSSLLYFGDIDGADAATLELLDYLIHVCPSTLRIPGASPHRHNAFSAVVQRCRNPNHPRHRHIVESVMRYAEQHDLDAIIPGSNNRTLLDVARQKNNILVLAYVAKAFAPEA